MKEAELPCLNFEVKFHITDKSEGAVVFKVTCQILAIVLKNVLRKFCFFGYSLQSSLIMQCALNG